MAPSQGNASVSRRPPDIEDYIDMLRRHRSWIIGPIFLGLVVAVVVAYLWPDTYVSSAVMQITPQQISERLVPSNVSVQMGQRLSQMEQEILSRTSLSELIQRPSLDLYKEQRQRMPIEDVVDKMLKNISIRMIGPPVGGRGGQPASAFQIAFAYTDRYKAQAVVRELVAKFIEQNVTVLRTQSSLTTSFFNDELNSAKAGLDKAENELTKFRVENAGRLPDQMQSNLEALNSLQTQLAAVTETLNRNSQEKMMLESQLQYLKNQESMISSGGDEPSPAQTVTDQRLIQLNKMIVDTETALAAARQRYKDDFPDVRSLKARLEALKSDRDSLLAQEQKNPQVSAKVKPVLNPRMRRTLDEAKRAIAEVQTEIRIKQMEIQDHIKQQADLHKQIEAYQNRIQLSPVNEAKYAELMRDRNLAKDKYEEMARKREISQTANNLEQRKAGENLEVLDPPSLPEAPSAPNRGIIICVGLGMGLMLGVFLAGVKEMKDTSLKNLKDVRAYTNLAVLSSIPLLENALVVRNRRRMVWLAWSSAVIIGTIAMSSSMYYYYFGRR